MKFAVSGGKMSRKRIIIIIPTILFAVTICLGIVFLKDVPATPQKGIYSELNVFNQILNLISDYYVEETAADSLVIDAINGMLEQLDPHTNYISPDRFERMDERNRGSYSGIGISFAIRDGWLTVISPLEGGPSERLGIRPGDVITHIEQESAEGIREDDVFEKLRGPRGSKVNVTVRRAGESDLMDFEIVRDNILIESVPYAFMLNPGIGYIRMARFSAKTSNELEAALLQLEDEGMEKLILDLRGNSGGFLNQAIEVSDKFLDGGKKIVYTQGRISGSSEEYHSSNRKHPDFPIVVLINAASASASEIVSGAIQDWDRGIVAGRTSFGKGLVQRQYPLPNNGALLLTVARYYTPSGRLIQRPYKAGDREDYYMHAGDADMSGDDDSTAVVPDPDPQISEADSLADERPVYHTLIQGRPVYGGGGITPDVELNNFQYASRLNTRLIIDRKYFDYITDAIAEKRIRWSGSFEDYLKEFEVKDDTMDHFRGYLEADSFAFEPDTFTVHLDELRDRMRAEIAHHLWSENERYHVLIAEDPVVLDAIDLLPQAEALFKESQRLWK
jgi:carboxyl-terminal processing protease